jgi:hypothetical protein
MKPRRGAASTQRREIMEQMDLLADTRRDLAMAIQQLEVINSGIPIAPPLTRDEAINIVTEHIGFFESVLRRYKNKESTSRY